MASDDAEIHLSRWARGLTQAPLLLSKHLWVWPLLGAVILGLVGFWVRDRVEESTKAELAAHLNTVLHADIAALRLWIAEREADARSLAADTRFQEAIEELAVLGHDTNVTAGALVNAPGARALHRYLMPLLEPEHYLDYVVVATNKQILASPRRFLVNRPYPLGYERFVGRALDGRASVSRPLLQASPSQHSEGPTMFVATPVKSTNGAVIAVLGLRMKPEAEFSAIFSVARMGETGEAYAFDRHGMMLTASRFDTELKALGLIPNTPEASSVLSLRLLDPGADLQRELMRTNPAALLVSSNRATVAVAAPLRPAQPAADDRLTVMASAATHGLAGCNVEGYRNYRGVQVVGAWDWLPEIGMGVATEVAAGEAFRTLYVLRTVFLVLFLLLVLASIGIFGFTLVVERLQASVRNSTLAARRLGQYVLVQEIGRGSNGMVYRARHTLLRRPVAVKLLSPELTNVAAVAHFEREVQMTSQLTHPNTVAVYDYGRTPEGLFYYAMEYLGGIDLDHLIRQFGPQPEGRVIYILRQICGSLAEAHRIGLIHRDIKPANIVLTRRGGLCDVVKVVDFGLVKTVDGGAEGFRAQTIVGTPHFMPPEALKPPGALDARSDIYSLGAVAYWLLTGTTVFQAEQLEPLLARLASDAPVPPSQRLGRACSPDLENLILQCLAKSPAERPATAEALEQALAACHSAGDWTNADAARWWQENPLKTEEVTGAALLEKTLVIAPRT